ncbi:MAG: glycoside hydrolase family 2 TIM barrel-domain containing protein [Ignavibacteria bacterium]
MPVQNFSHSAILSIILLAFMSAIFSGCSQKNAMTINMNNDWFIYPSEKLDADGDVISSQGYSIEGWYKTDVPKTVLAALVENGVYEDPYYNMNILDIPEKQFENPWWYRKEFIIDDLNENINYQLIFEGINYKAELWINGKQIAGEDQIEGAFGIFKFDVTANLKKGVNVVAVKIIPPIKGDLTIGFVDWNPTAPDKMMGLWRGVKLKKTDVVSINDIFVQTKLDETYTRAEIIISGELKNYSDKKVAGIVSGEFGEGIKFSKPFSLEANGSEKIIISSKEEPALSVKDPKLWYPNNLGEPYLYNLSVKVNVDNNVSDKENVGFGIREVDDYINEAGYRGYKVNGKKILIKGAGWVDDMMLNDSDEKVRAQVEYAKHMNLNTIRLEGFWGKNRTLYDAADENGLLLMVGWSCQWEWTVYCGREEDKHMCIRTPKDIELHTKQFNEQVKWLRNHPSVLVWVTGSDKYPSPEVQAKLNSYLSESDPTRPILISCQNIEVSPEENQNNIYEDSRVKMNGPYDYEPPVYWYVDTEYGGAYGFNTETGPGPQVPPLESLKKMFPEENLWPIDSMWNFHCGRNQFNNLDNYLTAFNHRYGQASSVEEFAMKSQMSNYEAMRPMFEAFEVNKFNATGVIQWMFNSAWPEMFWQFFDYYLMPNGAFYGAMKGCQPLNIVYNYKDKDIYVVNDYNKPVTNLNTSVKILDANSNILFEKEDKISIDENSSKKIFDLPKIVSQTNLYFVNMELRDSKNNFVSDNFYWLSKIDDVLDFENSEWFYSPIKTFADLKEINKLPEAKISYKEKYSEENGEQVVEVTLKNDSDKLAFFNELKVVNETTNESILPVFWSDNYMSLLPGSQKNITGRFKKTDNETKVKLIVNGWNSTIQ